MSPNLKTTGHSRDEDSSTTARRSSAVRACGECRRRKRRCNGVHPCELCIYNKRPNLCYYLDPRPSRKDVDNLASIADKYRKVIEQLFPLTPLEQLFDLTREQLMELMFTSDSFQLPRSSSPLPRSASPSQASSSQGDDLETLQIVPPIESGFSYESTDVTDTILDDINALSLTPRQPSSYLGISSTNAVFKVIMLINPTFVLLRGAQNFTPKFDLTTRSLVTAVKTPHFHDPEHSHVSGLQLIDAFFNYVHLIVPLLDEAQFRVTYLLGVRRDDRWLALLNTVFALGCLSICGADHTCHNDFYQQAITRLNLRSLGEVHLETVQTLGLLAGHYLHLVSQPNLAYSLTGVAIRMATALGLHKEFSNHHRMVDQNIQADESLIAIRQRVWWSLFVVDTWGCMTLGRPTFGRLGPAITIKLPNHVEGQNLLETVLLIETVSFCKIATEIQDVLAMAPTIPSHEIDRLDGQLVNWYEHIPLLLKGDGPCEEAVTTARTTLKWRFHNLRIMLHRPTLLRFAIRRVPYQSLCDEDRVSIQKCRSTACEAIQDMADRTVTDPTMGRAIVWWMFQASLVPLLGLFLPENTLPAEDAAGTLESCRAQVEVVVSTILRMETWAHTARRTSEVVSQIFNAAQQEHRMNISKSLSTSGTETNCNLQANNMFNSVNHGSLQIPQHHPPHCSNETANNQDFLHAPHTESSLNVPDELLWDSMNWAADDDWFSSMCLGNTTWADQEISSQGFKYGL